MLLHRHRFLSSTSRIRWRSAPSWLDLNDRRVASSTRTTSNRSASYSRRREHSWHSQGAADRTFIRGSAPDTDDIPEACSAEPVRCDRRGRELDELVGKDIKRCSTRTDLLLSRAHSWKRPIARSLPDLGRNRQEHFSQAARCRFHLSQNVSVPADTQPLAKPLAEVTAQIAWADGTCQCTFCVGITGETSLTLTCSKCKSISAIVTWEGMVLIGSRSVLGTVFG
jgi:hypothetical protein